jgi:GTPase SAR1 family protein
VEPYYPTIERPYFKRIPFKGVDYDVSIIDTAGQDEYSLISAKHAVGVHGYILVYSITNRQSFEMIGIVYEKLKNFQVRLFSCRRDGRDSPRHIRTSTTYPPLWSDRSVIW